MNLTKIKLDDQAISRFCDMPGFAIPDHSIIRKIDVDYFHIGLLVETNSKILGRCALYLNSNHNKNDKKSLTIGYFESYDDDAIVCCLFDEVKIIATKLKCDFIVGPINSSTWNEYRFNTEGDHNHFTSEYNIPHFYPKLWKQYGFVTADIYKSDLIDISKEKHLPTSTSSKVEHKNVILSDLTNRDLNLELGRIGRLSLRSFSKNHFYTPIDISKFISRYDLSYLDTIRKYIIIAESENGELLGYLFSFPNYLDKKSNGLVVKTFARHANSQYKGIGKLLCQKIYSVAISDGFDYIINAYYHQNNVSGKLSTGFNGNQIRTYELLEYKIS